MFILTDAEKAFDEILNPFRIKLTRLGLEGSFLNIAKLFINNQQQAYSHSTISEAFLLNSGVRQGCLLSSFLFHIGEPCPCNNRREKRRGRRIGKEEMQVFSFAEYNCLHR